MSAVDYDHPSIEPREVDARDEPGGASAQNDAIVHRHFRLLASAWEFGSGRVRMRPNRRTGEVFPITRSVVFCPIEELDEVLTASNADEFLQTLRKCQLCEFEGWPFNNIREPPDSDRLERRPYPFAIDGALP
ncbi:hypothetical protein [Ensifer aridi]|uniref:hypothetical protein n=1 Tax=Ensifer aridi TaxID=1708715 RepID=UPI0014310E13|nr:hypothetical protein [Ensifer aridi]